MTARFELQTLEEYSEGAMLAELHRVADLLNGQRLTRDRFDQLARVHSSTLSTRFGSWQAALDRAQIDDAIAPRTRRVSRHDVIEAIRGYVAEKSGAPPTVAAIAQRLGIDRNGLTRKFGIWSELLTEVGLKPVALGRRYTDSECFENLLSLWTYYGRQPHYAELNHPPSVVGSKAYVRRWGGWRAALSAFVKAANAVELAEPANGSGARTEEAATAVPRPTTAEPRSMSLSLRYRVLSRDRFRCVACGRSPAKDGDVDLHVDHVIPWSRGGASVESNLRTLCSSCNLGKGANIDDA